MTTRLRWNRREESHIYGLKQASRAWHNTLHQWLTSIGFKQFHSESTFYFKIIDGKKIIVGWHVDDGLLACSNFFMQTILDMFNDGPFKVTDLGEPTFSLGCKVERNCKEG